MEEFQKLQEWSCAHQILQAVVKQWRQVKVETATFSSVLMKGIVQAGIPLRGPDVLQMHHIFLKYLLRLELNSSLSESGLEWCDYFDLLAHDDLRWHEIAHEMLPYMAISEAESYMEELVNYISRAEKMPAAYATPGMICLCMTGLSFCLRILLDLVRLPSGFTNDSVSHHLAIVTSSTKCINILTLLVNTEPGLAVLTGREDTFRAVVWPLLLVTLLACPALSVEDTRSCLGQYLTKRVALKAVDKAPVQDTARVKLRKKTRLRKQREEGWVGGDELVKPTIELRLDESGDRARVEAIEDNIVNEKGITVVVKDSVDSGISTQSETFREENVLLPVTQHCCNAISVMKSMDHDVYANLVFTFCRGYYSVHKAFYQALEKIAMQQDSYSSGQHQIDSTILHDLIFPLLNELVRSRHAICETSVGNSTVGTDIISVDNKVDETDLLKLPKNQGHKGGNSLEESVTVTLNTSLIPACLKKEGKSFPEELLTSFSEVETILASGRQLDKEGDLQMLQRVVKAKEHGWRELLSLGLSSVDFEGWWKSGFFNLFWEHEESLATEGNVMRVLRAVGHAVQSCKEGLSHQSVVADLSKLLSVMFLRLPIVLQERVVLQHHTDGPAEENERKHQGSGNSSSIQLISSLKEERAAAAELTLILNKLTLSNANQLTPHLLYLCLFHPVTVLRHVVQAAVSSHGQTDSTVKVLQSMPGLCRLQHPVKECSNLVGCLQEEIFSSELEEKQAQNVISFFSAITEPYTLTLGEGKYLQKEAMPGVLSLKDLLHSFIFPSLSSAIDGLVCESACLATLELSMSLDLALASLAMLLEREKAAGSCGNLQMFHPLPLLIALCDCFSQNYTLMVTRVDPVIPKDEETDREKGRGLGPGELHFHMSRTRKTLRQLSHKCLSLLLDQVAPVWNTLSDIEQTWLLQETAQRDWLTAPLLAPVLTNNPAWRDVCSSAIDQLCENIITLETNCIKRLVRLLQLGLVNDTMSSQVIQRLSHHTGSWDQACVLVAVKWVLLTSMPSEMGRLVRLVRCLRKLTPQYKFTQPGTNSEGASASTEEPGPVKTDGQLPWQAEVSKILTDAVLLLDPSSEPLVVRCHALTTYQTAIQALVTCVVPSLPGTHLLTVIFSHLCAVLASPMVRNDEITTGQCGETSETEEKAEDDDDEMTISGQPIHILQVTAMDVLARIKAGLDDRRGQQKAGDGTANKRPSRVKERSTKKNLAAWDAHPDVAGQVSDLISCVHAPTVRIVLAKQLNDSGS